MARSTELNEKMKDERRIKILKGSLKLFATRGLSATKISDIAKECKMSQGLVYHYYNNKETIFIELIDTAFSKLIEACLWLKEQELNPKEKISLGIEKIIELIKKDRAFAYNSLLIAQASVNESIPKLAKKIIIKKNKIPYKIVSEIFEEGISRGLFIKNDPNEMATFFWTIINGLAIYRSSHGDNSHLPKLSMLLNGFSINKVEAL